MSNVIQFPIRSEAVAEDVATDPPEPHMTGDAKCLSCGHAWQAVAPVGTVGIECPSCALFKGVFVNPAAHSSEMHFRCNCGSEVFCLTIARVYCPNCGLSHRPFDSDTKAGA